MRTTRDILSARMRKHEGDQRAWTKKMLKINCIAGIIVGALLFGQDALADTWLDVHISSSHIGSDGYWMWEEVPSNGFTIPRGATHATGSFLDRTYWRQATYEWNEDNFGLGVDHDLTEHLSAVAGFFYNSFDIVTYYGGFDLHTSRQRPVQVGVAFGPMEGYEETRTPMEWMAQPNIMAELGDFRARVGWIPGSVIEAFTGEEAIDVLTFTVSWRFR